MVLYETLGGMRSVAWTDVIQGVLLLAGVVFIFFAIQIEYGGFVEAGRLIQSKQPNAFLPPDWNEKRLWFSTILLAFFGISVYPHAIQRIYAAKNESTLIRSFQITGLYAPFYNIIHGGGWLGRFSSIP